MPYKVKKGLIGYKLEDENGKALKIKDQNPPIKLYKDGTFRIVREDGSLTSAFDTLTKNTTERSLKECFNASKGYTHCFYKQNGEISPELTEIGSHFLIDKDLNVYIAFGDYEKTHYKLADINNPYIIDGDRQYLKVVDENGKVGALNEAGNIVVPFYFDLNSNIKVRSYNKGTTYYVEDKDKQMGFITIRANGEPCFSFSTKKKTLHVVDNNILLLEDNESGKIQKLELDYKTFRYNVGEEYTGELDSKTIQLNPFKDPQKLTVFDDKVLLDGNQILEGFNSFSLHSAALQKPYIIFRDPNSGLAGIYDVTDKKVLIPPSYASIVPSSSNFDSLTQKACFLVSNDNLNYGIVDQNGGALSEQCYRIPTKKQKIKNSEVLLDQNGEMVLYDKDSKENHITNAEDTKKIIEEIRQKQLAEAKKAAKDNSSMETDFDCKLKNDKDEFTLVDAFVLIEFGPVGYAIKKSLEEDFSENEL